MSTQKIVNIITGILAIGICYLLIFDNATNDKILWGLLALFFIAQVVRIRIKKNTEGKAGNNVS